ncbi:MAG TPA: muconolactone Delta-isomerase family protein [Ktedonobacterales bacterium]|nr:muconolactone Delta-isomerase family protein [Ktedonobacterales bacterium]
MNYMVSISFVQGKQDAIAAGMAAEQARVRELTEQGAIQSLSIAADRSHIWLVMQGESQDHIQQALVSLPLYPYMHLELMPLLDLAPFR